MKDEHPLENLVAALRESLAVKDRELADAQQAFIDGESEARRIRHEYQEIRHSDCQEIVRLTGERDEWKTRAEAARLTVMGARMTECHIGPLFFAGWNGCIEHLEKQINAAITAQEPTK